MEPLQPLPYGSIQDARGPQDRQHLLLLGIFHFVFAGVLFVGAGGIWFISSLVHRQTGPSAPPPFSLSPMIGLYLGWGLVNAISALCILIRRGRIFSLSLAGINCLFVPLGTALGVFTYIVLLRDSVRRLYASPKY